LVVAKLYRSLFIDDKDQFASFSNDGKCVDILAPGTSILSDTKTNASLANVKMWYSGTSYSAPHVAGVLALLSATNTTSDHYQVIQQLYSLATPDIIKNVTEGTANLLAFNGVETSQMSSSMESTKHRASDASAVVPVFISAYASCLTLLSFWAWWL
jgi:subtilisin family serine protease